jgi:hypothetical protein
MDLNIWAAAEYAIGQPFFFPEGQRVICNGYPGIVAQMYDKGIVEVRLGTGRVCCSATYPDVYPDPLDLVWRMEPPVDRLTLFNRTGREFVVLRRQGRKWVSETGETHRRCEAAMRAAEQYARVRIQTEVDERTSRLTAHLPVTPAGAPASALHAASGGMRP